MMWNALVSTLLVRASIVMIDGNPNYPDLSLQWRLAAETRATMFGLSPAFTMACRKEGLEPGRTYDLSAIRTLCEAGSPLPVEGYEWLYEQVGLEVYLNVSSGGTDVCTGIVQGYPLLPVYAGEMSAPCLGVDAAAFDADGEPVVGELSELVIRRPMPSMPVQFWNDPDGSRYRAAYFEHYPCVWRHGDWILFAERGSSMITGRSDATLNRGGVRIGTSELYGVVRSSTRCSTASSSTWRRRTTCSCSSSSATESSSTTGCGPGSPTRCARVCHRGTGPTTSSPSPQSRAR
jgi:acetoacetyl-CoA synthetase